jgi:hypothetical protein
MKKELTTDALKKLSEKKVADGNIKTLHTDVTAAQANHSYNGIIFDVESKDTYEINVHSVSVGGMLGRVRVFARDQPWEHGKADNSVPSHWWAHRESLSTSGWELVADQFCHPSWDKPIEIVFTKPMHLYPHERKAIYCHSGLPDDLGIQYQSYKREAIIAEDDKIVLHPGLGHTGSQVEFERRGKKPHYIVVHL